MSFITEEYREADSKFNDFAFSIIFEYSINKIKGKININPHFYKNTY